MSEKNNRSARTIHSLGIIVVAGVWLALSVWSAFKPADAVSLSERRKLAQKPECSVETLLDGSYMTDFETYTLDQFPLRDSFRTLKAATSFYALGKKDNNGIYLADGYAAKLEYPLNTDSVKGAVRKIQYLYDTYARDKAQGVYVAVAPDKSYFLAEKNGYPVMDYDELTSLMREGLPFAEYVDLFPLLELEDYYKTDTHWRQEKLFDAANRLSEAMGAKPMERETCDLVTADTPFYGVYYGQAALPLPADSLTYVVNDTLTNCITTNVETGKSYSGVLDFEKLESSDPYEVFLSGASAVVYVENPKAETEKELVIFRDSFGSSMAPLLLEGYSRITLVDTRYILPELVGEFVDFEQADVLFLYSTLILNQSEALKDARK